jgi:hypothetical protein
MYLKTVLFSYDCFCFGALQAVFETRLRELSIALPLMCCAADMLYVPSRKQVVLVGQKGSAEFQDMVAAAFSTYDPNRTVSEEDFLLQTFSVLFRIIIAAAAGSFTRLSNLLWSPVSVYLTTVHVSD